MNLQSEGGRVQTTEMFFFFVFFRSITLQLAFPPCHDLIFENQLLSLLKKTPDSSFVTNLIV